MMVKILQISSELNVGSVGRIAEQIGEKVCEEGWESFIAYGREAGETQSTSYKIGRPFDFYFHVIYSRITDKHGLGSKRATKRLILEIERINPDIIQLQHLHGYFVNYKVLFEYFSYKNIPVVWTFHDCWAFTGHCAHYEYIGCEKWITQCHNCPQIAEYPKAYVDNSFANYNIKKEIFTSLSNLTIVPVSYWLAGEVEKSFLKHQRIDVIQNGIDLDCFRFTDSIELAEKYNLLGKFVILGVANPWNERKGLKYFVELNKCLGSKHQIVIVGLTKSQIESLPGNIIGLERTNSVYELAQFYSLADVFVNPTLEDTFPTTNLEALACETPVITFRSGGSPEAISDDTGYVVEKGNIVQVERAIQEIMEKGSSSFRLPCRLRAEEYFDKKKNFKKYIDLYKKILSKS